MHNLYTFTITIREMPLKNSTVVKKVLSMQQKEDEHLLSIGIYYRMT
jgi:hypothetical protein